MNVKQITADYLRANGFDGLYARDGDNCGCKLDDLMCCGCEGIDTCEPGYLIPPPAGYEDLECSFWIGPEKP